MSEKIETGGPAFPRITKITSPAIRDQKVHSENGMTMREYAAIKLRVPSSGTDWLDEMIRESLHNEAAVDVLKASLSKKGPIAVLDFDLMVGLAREMTDAMLKARKAE